MLTRLIILLAFVLGSATAAHAFNVEEDDNFIYIIKPWKDVWENKTAVNILSDNTEKSLKKAIEKVNSGSFTPPKTNKPSLSRVSSRSSNTSSIVKDYKKENEGPRALTALISEMNKVVAKRRSKNPRAGSRTGFGAFLSNLINIFDPTSISNEELEAELDSNYKKTKSNHALGLLPDSVMVYTGFSFLNKEIFTEKLKLSGNFSVGINLMPRRITIISKKTGKTIGHKNELDKSVIGFAGPDLKIANKHSGLVGMRIGVMPIWSNHETAYYQSKQFYGFGGSFSKDIRIPMTNQKVNFKIGGVTTYAMSSAVDFTVASLSYNIKGESKEFGRINATGYMPADVILAAAQKRAEEKAQKNATKVAISAIEEIITAIEESPEIDLNLSNEELEASDQ